ncbi:hypothetical protein Hanom_Chr07g00621131 [Helianthus anomalus]
MGVENWRKTIDLFGDPKYIKSCEVNQKNREKQKIANRGGSASYSSWSFKKNMDALETYAHAHTLPDGTFASPLEEENFVSFCLKYNSYIYIFKNSNRHIIIYIYIIYRFEFCKCLQRIFAIGCRFVLLLSTVTKRPICTLVIEFVYIHGLSFNYLCKIQNLLKEEFERQRTQNNPFLEDEGELGESSVPAISNVQVFEKVLGARRGIYRGLGRKPSLSSSSSDVSPHEEKTRPQFSELSFDVILICSDHVLNILFVSICFS